MTHSTQQATAGGGQERILRNTSYLTAAFVVQKILSFLYFIFIAKALGPSDLGLYEPAKAFIPILLILIDFSLSPVMTREIARKPERAVTFLSNILSVKAIFAVVLLILFGFVTNFSTFGEIERSVIYLIACVVAFDSFTSSFFSVFRGLQNMKFEALGMILTQLVTIAIGLITLFEGFGIRGLFVSTLVGSLANFVFGMVIIKRKLGVFPAFRWNKEIIKSFLRMAVPFALTAILAKLLTYTDRFILFLGVARTQVGFYSTAHKLTFALEFLPASFAAAFYPAMSAYFATDKKQLGYIFERALFYLIIIAIPIGVGCLFLADQIFFTLWAGDYADSIIPFQIMISTILVIFCNFPVGSLLNAMNKQHINTINMAVTVLVNLVLNLLLIGRFAHIGSAIATAASMTLLFILGLTRVNALITYNGFKLFRTAIYALALAGCSIILVLFVKPFTSLFITLPVFAIAYGGSLFLFKIVQKSDISVLLRAVLRKKV